MQRGTRRPAGVGVVRETGAAEGLSDAAAVELRRRPRARVGARVGIGTAGGRSSGTDGRGVRVGARSSVGTSRPRRGHVVGTPWADGRPPSPRPSTRWSEPTRPARFSGRVIGRRCRSGLTRRRRSGAFPRSRCSDPHGAAPRAVGRLAREGRATARGAARPPRAALRARGSLPGGEGLADPDRAAAAGTEPQGGVGDEPGGGWPPGEEPRRPQLTPGRGSERRVGGRRAGAGPRPPGVCGAPEATSRRGGARRGERRPAAAARARPRASPGAPHPERDVATEGAERTQGTRREARRARASDTSTARPGKGARAHQRRSKTRTTGPGADDAASSPRRSPERASTGRPGRRPRVGGRGDPGPGTVARGVE